MKKTRKKAKNVVLCERDMQVMRLLFENKIVSREQINNQFFPSVSTQTVNRRLRKIMGLGLIRRKPVGRGHGAIFCYSLTQRGLAEIKPTLPYEVKVMRSSSECPLHDIALNDVRRAFEAKSAVQNYHTENVLQTSTELREERKFQPFIELNSDAMAEVDSSVGVLNLAIEFDTTHKSKSRYLHKINAYYGRQTIDGVLYICASEHILNALRKIDKEVSDCHKCEHKLYFALLADVTDAIGEMTFRSADRGIFCVG